MQTNHFYHNFDQNFNNLMKIMFKMISLHEFD